MSVRPAFIMLFCFIFTVLATGCQDLEDPLPTQADEDGIIPQMAYEWTRRIGGTARDEIVDSCLDAEGNLYVVGRFGETVDFAEDWGSSDSRTVTWEAAFVTKVGADGAYHWTRIVEGWVTPYSVCCDNTGHILVAGKFRDTVNFAGDWGGSDSRDTLGSTDAFLMKLTTDGDYCCTRRIGGLSNSAAQAVCVDNEDNVYLTGWFGGSINFGAEWGATEEKTSAGSPDIFITKVDSTDQYCWTYRIGDSGGQEPHAVCTDTEGNVFFAGRYYANRPWVVNFAEDWGKRDGKVSAANDKMFVTKVTREGEYCWTHRFGTVLGGTAMDMCSDGNGNIYVTGYSGLYAGVFKLNTHGICLWRRKIDSMVCTGIAVDNSGRVVVAGPYNDVLKFPGYWRGTWTKTENACIDIFVTLISPDGNYFSTHTVRGLNDDRPHDVIVDSTGNVYVVGSFGYKEYVEGNQDTINFAESWGETDVKTSAGGADGFITKLRILE